MRSWYAGSGRGRCCLRDRNTNPRTRRRHHTMASEQPDRRKPSTAPHAIIVGAGFAGLSAVGELRRAPVHVTIIDKNLYSTFQPLLYQVATGGLNPGDVSYPVGSFSAKRHT